MLYIYLSLHVYSNTNTPHDADTLVEAISIRQF